jgi:hypothetical protein
MPADLDLATPPEREPQSEWADSHRVRCPTLRIRLRFRNAGLARSHEPVNAGALQSRQARLQSVRQLKLW